MKWLNRLFGGPKEMAALTAGTQAPGISLPTLDGKQFVLREALQHGPVLAAFFKVSCPVCQYTFPYLERLHQAYGDQKVTIVGISQDDRRNTEAYLKEYGVTFPTLLDDPNGYAVSNAYGLTNVPTWFLIGQDGEIEISSVGWVKTEVEDASRRLAELQKTPPRPLFQAGEDVRDFRAG
jgi:peroxiredoxin